MKLVGCNPVNFGASVADGSATAPDLRDQHAVARSDPVAPGSRRSAYKFAGAEFSIFYLLWPISPPDQASGIDRRLTDRPASMAVRRRVIATSKPLPVHVAVHAYSSYDASVRWVR